MLSTENHDLILKKTFFRDIHKATKSHSQLWRRAGDWCVNALCSYSSNISVLYDRIPETTAPTYLCCMIEYQRQPSHTTAIPTTVPSRQRLCCRYIIVHIVTKYCLETLQYAGLCNTGKNWKKISKEDSTRNPNCCNTNNFFVVSLLQPLLSYVIV